MKKLVTFVADEHDTYTMIFNLSDEDLEIVKKGRKQLELLGPEVQELGISWNPPDRYTEEVMGLQEVMSSDPENDYDPLRVQYCRLHITSTSLWFQVVCKDTTVTTWGMEWREIEPLLNGTFEPDVFFTESFLSVHGDTLVADLDVSDLLGWDIETLPQDSGNYAAVTYNGVEQQRFAEPFSAWRFLIDKAAQEQVEHELHRAGIIEDPDMDGGLFG